MISTPNHAVFGRIRQIVWISVVVIFCSSGIAHAQQPTRTASFVVSPADARITLDLLTIPGSIRVRHADTLLTAQWYDFDAQSGVLALHWPRHWPSFPATISVSWTYLPVSIQRRYQLFSESEEAVLSEHPDSLAYPTTNARRPENRLAESDFGANRLQSRGNITRGVIVGSNRDFGLESGLRFELQGEVADNVMLSAVLSDQNSLIQPDGTTQSLREFDQVYIRLDAPSASVQLGDVDVQLRQSEIFQLNRRIQGAQATVSHKDYLTATTAAAVLRGTHNVQEFQGQQGRQGPYRLTGNSGEAFVVVVAGTEQVFLDGRRLVRGDENDYIIDYSVGEIYFTSKRLIRSTDRIRVEYQFLTNSYTRSLIATEVRHDRLASGSISAGVTYVRQADNTYLDDTFGLNEADLSLLRLAGNNRNLMRAPSADSIGFRPDFPAILYTQTDTLFDAQPTRIYQYIPGDPQGVWRVQFTRVPTGTGSYRRGTQTTNGIVYEWIGSGGDFEPFRQLEAPQLQQAFSVFGDFRLHEKVHLYSEWGTSQRDANRFSTRSASEQGQMTINRLSFKQVALSDRLTLHADVHHEFKGSNFTFLDPVRAIEYNRHWNIDPLLTSDEKRYGARFRLESDQTELLQYELQRLEQASVSGLRQTAGMQVREKGLPEVLVNASHLNSSNTVSEITTRWITLQGTTQWENQWSGVQWMPFYHISLERKEDVGSESSRRLPASLAYTEHEPGVRIAFGESFDIGASLSARSDYRVDEGVLRRQFITQSQNVTMGYRYRDWWTSRTRIANQVRTEAADFAGGSENRVNRGVAIRTDHDIRMLGNMIQGNVLYDLSSQNTSVMQEIYLEVGPEFGQFVWVDLNEDGIQQIDEFFPETTPNEGTYVRQLLSSDALLPVIAFTGSASVRIDPSRRYRAMQLGGFAGWIVSNVSYESRFDIHEQNKSKDWKGIGLLNPQVFLSDGNTISGRYTWSQRLNLLGSVPEKDLRLVTTQHEQLSELVTGSEYGRSIEYRIEAGFPLSDRWKTEQLSGRRLRQNRSVGIPSRGYDITGWFSEAMVAFEAENGTNLSISLKGSLMQDRFGQEVATVSAWRAEQRGVFFSTTKFQFHYNVEYRNMALSGNTTPLGEFEMTEGAGRGESWLWGMHMQWVNSSNIRTMIHYDGRTTAQSGTIQTLRVSVSATF